MQFSYLIPAALLAMTAAPAAAGSPQWIWRDQKERPSPAGERAYLRRTFRIESGVQKATLEAACAGAMEVYVNGKSVGTSAEVRQPVRADVTARLQPWAENTLAVFGRSTADGVGLAVRLTVEQEYGKRQIFGTDADWRISLDNPKGWESAHFDDKAWAKVAVMGELDAKPFGNVFVSNTPGATPPEDLTAPPGFKIELLRSAGPREGSWVCMTIDSAGRLYISPQNAIPESGFSKTSQWGGIWRVTLDGMGQIAKWDKVMVPIGGCMGMLWAFDSLYLSGQGPEGVAIYRCRDTNGDGEIDSWALFKKVPGGAGEHGAHAMVLGPRDNKLYIAMGNSTPLIEGIAKDSPAQNMAEDDLLPRIKDPVATFFDNVKTPYGQILRTDEEGKNWELLATGFRNHYDIDFDASGELWTYDSDMEWDVGQPWYRPTRVLHIVSGADFGFREGCSKFPEYYEDTLPSVPVGLGSPTGVKFGTRFNAGGDYKSAFYILDWTYGRILAVHLKQDENEGVAGRVEEFIKGKGLPVTDLEFGNDGAMYFTVGGRGTQGGLYRVTSTSAAAGEAPKETPSKTRDARRKLDAAHGHPDRMTVDEIWPHLGSADRNLRFSARVALEQQPVDKWMRRSLDEADTQTALTALLALARVGGSDAQQPTVAKLGGMDLNQEQGLQGLRILQLSMIRQGKPAGALRDRIVDRLSEVYGRSNFSINREIGQTLVTLEAPDVVAPTLELLTDAMRRHAASPQPSDPMKLGPQEEQIWHARILCEVPAAHFSPAQRDQYLQWFAAARQLKGGNNFVKYIEAMRQRALGRLSPEERDRQERLHQDAIARAAATMAPPDSAPARKFVKMWTIADLEPHLGRIKAGRNFARGKEIYTSLLCAKCHKLGADGGGVGPDLTGVGGRFAPKDILEAITDPTKAISEQYAAQVVETKTSSYMGLVAGETDSILTIYTDPFGESKQDVKKAEITKREAAKISLMPPGLLGTLQLDEVLDLVAYLSSGGKPEAENFKPTP